MAFVYTLSDFFDSQRAWSYQTFGPPYHRGPVGPLKHLAKEVQEAIAETDHNKRIEEIVDCLFMVYEAAHRSGLSSTEFAKAAYMKLHKNQQRSWPNWQTADPNKPVEHDRSKDEPRN